MGYILFSQTSRGFGTRDLWNVVGSALDVPPLDRPPLERPGVIGWASLTPIAATGFDATTIRTGFGIGAGAVSAVQPAAAAFFTLGSPALAETAGQVLGVADPARSLAPTSVLSGEALSVRLADARWNAIKNVEVALEDADLRDVTSLAFRNIVDVRVRVGGEVNLPGRPIFELPFRLDVDNAKRGEVVATDSPLAVILDLNFWIDSKWNQTSLSFDGSNFNDQVYVDIGQRAVGAGDRWGRGMGTLVDGVSIYDGRRSTMIAQLGAGDDLFVASNTRTIGGITFTTSSVDHVSGGAGDDTLITGGGNDILNGGAGEDLIDGGTGNDRLTGGADFDRFVFGPADGIDIITDFSRRDGDVIEIMATGDELILNGSTFTFGNTVVTAENDYVWRARDFDTF